MDYCTGFFEGWWSTCCKIHDEMYSGVVSRVVADNQLFECVLNSGDGYYALLSIPIAGLMFLGVRVFGSRFYKKGV